MLEFAKHTWVWALAPASKLAAAARATNWLISKGSGASGTAQRSRGANVMRNKAYVHVLEVGYTLTGLENCNCSGTMAATSIYSSQEARQCVDVVYQGPRNRLPAACHYALDASMAIRRTWTTNRRSPYATKHLQSHELPNPPHRCFVSVSARFQQHSSCVYISGCSLCSGQAQVPSM